MFGLLKTLKSRILIMAGAGAAFAILILAVTIFVREEARIKDKAIQTVNGSVLLLEQNIHNTRTQLISFISVIQSNSAIKDALKARNRESLLRETEQYYSHIKQYMGVSHLYFTLPNRKNILRAHFPQRYGDIIKRNSQLDAERTGKTAYDVELGVFGTLTLRVVSPWWEDGKLLGYVEMGVEIQEIARQLEQSNSAEILIFIKKDLIDLDSFKRGFGKLPPNSDLDRFPSLVLTSPTSFVLPNDFDFIVKQSSKTTANSLVEKAIGGNQFYLLTVPIQDNLNNQIGYAAHLVNVSLENKQNIRAVTTTILTSSLVAFALLAAFWIYLNFFERDKRYIERSMLVANAFRVAARDYSANWQNDTLGTENTLGTEEDLIDSAPEGVAIFTVDNRLALFNAACKEIFPLISDHVTIGMTFEDYTRLAVKMKQIRLNKGDNDKYIKQRIEHYKNPKSSFVVQLHDGRYIEILERKTREGGTVIIYHDISKEKEMKQNMTRLSRAIEQSPVSTVITDVNGNIEYVNKKFTSLTGYEAYEVIGQNPRILGSHTTSNDVYKNLWETILSGKVWRNELKNKHKDGSMYFVSANIFPIKDDDGKLTNFIGMQEDLSELKKYQDEVRKNESMLSLHFERTPLAAITWDTNFRAIMWNPAAETIFGFSKEEALGKSAKELILVPELKEHIINEIFQLLLEKTGGESSINENITKDGRRITCEWYNTSLVDDAGNVTGVASLAQDVTWRKISEEQLIKAKQEAEKSNQAKSEFLANIGHELRTPLHGILSHTSLGKYALEMGDEETLVQCLARIQDGSARLNDLIGSLLKLGKTDSEYKHLKIEMVDLYDLMQKTIQEMHGLAEEKNIKIVMNKPDFNVIVSVDKVEMYQAFGNLISNAIKFSYDRGVINISFSNAQLSVNNAGHDKVDAVKVSVCDCGVGIPENELDDIFDKFSQSSRTNTGAGASGLGLSICKKSVDIHHGKIWAENNPSGGSVFHVMLPKLKLEIDSE